MVLNFDMFDNDRPVLIAGPTASGKSGLALDIANRFGGQIINADALQVYAGWNVLTARPPAHDLAQADHYLYGHVANTTAYSVGSWLRDIETLLPTLPRPIIVGGTGLFFRALTEGLAEIPTISREFRDASEHILANDGLSGLLTDLSDDVQESIDVQNPKRVQRAWEVFAQTGRDITDWHRSTPPPLVPLSATIPIVMTPPVDWLNERIERRFDIMLQNGALDEAAANLDDWDPTRPANQAIGAPDLIAHLRGEISLQSARENSIIGTRQYAKRQRTWFRKRMHDWITFAPNDQT